MVGDLWADMSASSVNPRHPDVLRLLIASGPVSASPPTTSERPTNRARTIVQLSEAGGC
jgi:hypothetical protein